MAKKKQQASKSVFESVTEATGLLPSVAEDYKDFAFRVATAIGELDDAQYEALTKSHAVEEWYASACDAINNDKALPEMDGYTPTKAAAEEKEEDGDEEPEVEEEEQVQDEDEETEAEEEAPEEKKAKRGATAEGTEKKKGKKKEEPKRKPKVVKKAEPVTKETVTMKKAKVKAKVEKKVVVEAAKKKNGSTAKRAVAAATGNGKTVHAEPPQLRKACTAYKVRELVVKTPRISYDALCGKLGVKPKPYDHIWQRWNEARCVMAIVAQQ